MCECDLDFVIKFPNLSLNFTALTCSPFLWRPLKRHLRNGNFAGGRLTCGHLHMHGLLHPIFQYFTNQRINVLSMRSLPIIRYWVQKCGSIKWLYILSSFLKIIFARIESSLEITLAYTCTGSEFRGFSRNHTQNKKLAILFHL